MVVALAVALAGGAVTLAGDEMYFYVEDGNLVITNTPSRADVRPVTAEQVEAEIPPARMPATRYDPYIDIGAAESGQQ